MVCLVLTCGIMFVILVLTLIPICWITHIITWDFNKHLVAGVFRLPGLGHLSLQHVAGLG